MSISDRLDQIEARAEAVVGLTLGDDNARGAYNLVEDAVPDLVAALRAVLDLHKPEKFMDFEDTCSGCDIGTLDPPTWPCQTVRAVRAALGEGT